MAGLIFVLAIGLALVALLVRRTRSARRRQTARAMPGRSPERPLAVQRFDEMDEAVERTRCACGGRASFVSEASVEVGGGRLRVVHARCNDCDDDVDLF